MSSHWFITFKASEVEKTTAVSYPAFADPKTPPGTDYGGGLIQDKLKQNLTLILVGVAAAVVLLIVCIVSIAGVLACRRQPTVVLRRPRPSSKSPEELELSEAGFGEGFRRRSEQYRASMYGPELEQGPPIRIVTGTKSIPNKNIQFTDVACLTLTDYLYLLRVFIPYNNRLIAIYIITRS